MPEASRMMALQGAQQSALFGMRAAQDRRGGLASIGNIQAGLDRSNLAVAAQDASMRQQNQRFAQQALMTQAQYKDKAFANQFQSYMNKEQQRRALIGAGIQNLAGSADTFAAGYLQNQYTNALLGKDTAKTSSSTFGGTDLKSATGPKFYDPYRNSGMSAIMGGARMRAMPGAVRPTPNYIPTANLPFYNDAMQDLFSTEYQ
jgi:hypothetical protein